MKWFFELPPQIHIFATGKNEFPLTFLIYQGMKFNALSEYYPFASNENYDYDGTELNTGIEKFALRQNGTDGIYETLTKPYYKYFVENDKVTMRFRADIEMFKKISQIFMAQKGTKKIRNIKVMNKIFRLPEEFHFIITMEGIKECEGVLR